MKTQEQGRTSDEPSSDVRGTDCPGAEPSSPITQYSAAAAQWDAAGYPHDAARLYAAALDLQPHDIKMRMRLADCRVRCNQPAQAARLYLHVASDYARGQCRREAMAISHYVLILDPRQFVYGTVADMMRQIGQRASPLCTRAAELHIQRGRMADAVDILSLGTELDPHDHRMHRQLAQLLTSQCMLADALVHFERACRLLLAAGNNAEYIDVAEELLGHYPRHLATLRELPRVLLGVDEPEQAVVKISDLMRVRPGDLVGIELLAHASAVLGRTQTSLSLLERLVRELISGGQLEQATAIITRASGWRTADPWFDAATKDLLSAHPGWSLGRPDPYPVAHQDTLALGIADPTEHEPEPELETEPVPAPDPVPAPEEILDASDLVEIVDTEGSVLLRLDETSSVGPDPRSTLPRETTRASKRARRRARRAHPGMLASRYPTRDNIGTIAARCRAPDTSKSKASAIRSITQKHRHTRITSSIASSDSPASRIGSRSAGSIPQGSRVSLSRKLSAV